MTLLLLVLHTQHLCEGPGLCVGGRERMSQPQPGQVCLEAQGASRHFWEGSVHLCMLDGDACFLGKISEGIWVAKTEHHEQRLEVGPHSGGCQVEQSDRS